LAKAKVVSVRLLAISFWAFENVEGQHVVD
jgi:hypothetical protein